MQFRRICYPINDEEPTPALPKGGSLTPTPNPIPEQSSPTRSLSPREGGKGQAPTRSGGYAIRLLGV